MKRHFDEELVKIKEKLFRMGLLVEDAVVHANAALFQRDIDEARQVIQGDQEVNLYEIEIDEMVHELIALHQPAAADLRMLTMALKITNDLERIGDQAVNIAEAALIINTQPPLKPYQDLERMATSVKTMVHEALTAFMEQDQEKAKKILEHDDIIDQFNDTIYDELQTILGEKPEYVRVGVSLIMVSHNLERIADLATNIAEDVIYLKRGVDVRHHIRERREQQG